mgnify:CR=1 FL=1
MRLLISFLFLSLGLSAQIGTGQWRLHVPSNNAIGVVAQNDRVFAAFGNGVAEYEYSSGELSIWDAVNSLSDISLSCIGYSSSNDAVFIGYENGNIDRIKENGLVNIPAITLAQIQGSKRINSFVDYGGYIYAATGFAIVKIDPVKNEVRDTYYPTNGNQGIVDVAFHNDSIYALTEDKMYRGFASNIALADPAQWVIDTRIPELTQNAYTNLETVGDSLYLLFNDDLYGSDTVYCVRQNVIAPVAVQPFSEIKTIDEVEGRLAVSYPEAEIIYAGDYGIFNYIGSYPFGGKANVNDIVFNNGTYWLADEYAGLIKYENNSTAEIISFVGPPNKDFFNLDWSNGKLAVASGRLVDQDGNTYTRTGVYTFEDEAWVLSNPSELDMWKNQEIWDFSCISVNPINKELAAGTYSKIPLSILNENGIVTDTITSFNSPLELTSLGNGKTYLSDVTYDDEGNLWVLNAYSNKPLKVYDKNGAWYEFDTGTASKSRHAGKLVVDYQGNKWFAISGAGLYGYKDNGTISSLNDDEYVLLNSGENTGALPSNQVTAIAVDFDNEIWIGTDNGFAVLYNSDGAFGAGYGDYNAQRIKLEFEGNVEYVLGATSITDIEVDGANRKWFGTANAGIVLLSADGLEIIEQHTAENSPLISDNILDLELDQKTGELFIVTDKGLISYRTDATYEGEDYDDVTIFPNPARPEFDGPITIQGIRYDSDVRITDVAGNLVYQTTSNGGTATWNGRTLMGDKVATGVYLIWTAPNNPEVKGRKVGKVLVVN